MKKIAIVTSTRAEYGLLSPVIKELRKRENAELSVSLVVTGTHLSSDYGMTIDEIDDRIDHTIIIPVVSLSEEDISKNQSVALERFTELFVEERYNAIVLLGDRYETLAIAIAAGNTRTPIFHLCGGDTTEGAIDEWIRHSITKMSYLHFVTNDDSRRRVIQLGEDPQRVYNFGSTSIDNVLNAQLMTERELRSELGLPECIFAVCTYHPTTMDNVDVSSLIHDFLEAIKAFPNIHFIITKSNSDQGGEIINAMLDAAEKEISNIQVFASLGVKRYLSAMRYAEFVIGNSSSGIIEAPALHIPTVNIGDRQRGRLRSESVIDCESDSSSIISAINLALSDNHKNICKSVESPYGDGTASINIASQIVETVLKGKIDLKKHFYNLGEK